MSNVQHLEDTKYLQWADGMYVMLEVLMCDYEKALVEDSLRRSVYFKECRTDVCLDVRIKMVGVFSLACSKNPITKLTRAQALYIATGDTDI